MNKLSALAGIVGPPLFGGSLLILSCLEYDFLRSLGWHPLFAPTFDWPSGLALGPYGVVMQAVFVIEGVLMVVFAKGLSMIANMGQTLGGRPQGSALRGPWMASLLFALAGVGMAGLAFPADPTLRTTPATTAGSLHDASFVFLGLMLLPALLCYGRAFYSLWAWRSLGWLAYLAAALIIPAFAMKGWWLIAFLAAFLCWSEAAAWKLYRLRGGM